MNLKMELAFGVVVWSEIALGVCTVRQFAQGVYIIYINMKRLAVSNVHVNMCVMHCDTY